MVIAYMSLNLDAMDVDSHLEMVEDLQNPRVTETASTRVSRYYAAYCAAVTSTTFQEFPLGVYPAG
jgi:hypothetical protein